MNTLLLPQPTERKSLPIWIVDNMSRDGTLTALGWVVGGVISLTLLVASFAGGWVLNQNREAGIYAYRVEQLEVWRLDHTRYADSEYVERETMETALKIQRDALEFRIGQLEERIDEAQQQNAQGFKAIEDRLIQMQRAQGR